MARRGLLIVILLYVALDLSLPAMPGAFVFDPVGSVEGASSGRPRLTADMTAEASPTPHSPALLAPRADVPHRLPAPSRPLWLVSPGPSCLPRAVCALPAASEDPH
jgi:hypothetical protein